MLRYLTNSSMNNSNTTKIDLTPYAWWLPGKKLTVNKKN